MEHWITLVVLLNEWVPCQQLMVAVPHVKHPLQELLQCWVIVQGAFKIAIRLLPQSRLALLHLIGDEALFHAKAPCRHIED